MTDDVVHSQCSRNITLPFFSKFGQRLSNKVDLVIPKRSQRKKFKRPLRNCWSSNTPTNVNSRPFLPLSNVCCSNTILPTRPRPCCSTQFRRAALSALLCYYFVRDGAFRLELFRVETPLSSHRKSLHRSSTVSVIVTLRAVRLLCAKTYAGVQRGKTHNSTYQIRVPVQRKRPTSECPPSVFGTPASCQRLPSPHTKTRSERDRESHQQDDHSRETSYSSFV